MFWVLLVVVVVALLLSDVGRDSVTIRHNEERKAAREAENLARRIEAARRFYSWPFSIVAAAIWGFSLYVIFVL